MKPPLHIYVVWHPDFKEGEKYARSLYSAFNRDVENHLSSGIGIPVYYNSAIYNYNLPKPIDFDEAERTVVIALITDEIIASDDWQQYMLDINNEVEVDKLKRRFYCAALGNNPYALDDTISVNNYIRLNDVPKNHRFQYLIDQLSHELSRILYKMKSSVEVDANNIYEQTTRADEDKIMLFISHAKLDGLKIAEKIRCYIRSKTSLDSFFDGNDIRIGEDFTEEIEKYIKKSVLLVIQSDMYSSREWCRKEVLTAKKHNRPVLVVNCLENGEARSFPYMSNVPTLRISTNGITDIALNRIISATLKETLRFRYKSFYTAYILNKFNKKIPEDAIFSYPPELVTLLNTSKNRDDYIIYPDPPLGDEEIELLSKVHDKNKLLTTVEYLGIS